MILHRTFPPSLVRKLVPSSSYLVNRLCIGTLGATSQIYSILSPLSCHTLCRTTKSAQPLLYLYATYGPANKSPGVERAQENDPFIRQEALEKAREIQIKADEEFAIEKSKLVRQETSSIDSVYQKKHKQASMSQQITRSTLANKTRLRVLGSRQELLNDLFDKVREQLYEQSTDKGKYEQLCKGLVLEGLYALNEKKVGVRAREQDKDVVKKAIEGAKKEYKENLEADVEVSLGEKETLPEGS